MRPDARTRLANWACLVAYLLVGVLGSRGLVLCVGPGGHLMVEAAAPDKCGGCIERPAAPDSRAPDRTVGQAPVCPCDDVALAGDWQVARKRDAASAAELELRAPAAAIAWTLPPDAPRRTPGDVDRCSGADRAARSRPRSVVLRV